jgi:hypothetical protein
MYDKRYDIVAGVCLIGILLLAVALLVFALITPVTVGASTTDDYLVYIPAAFSEEIEVKNGSMEGVTRKSARFWQWGTPVGQDIETNEINAPDDWTVWWVEGEPCAGAPTEWFSGRPEVLLADLNDGFNDNLRVFDGNKALKWFTFYRCNHGGIFQTLPVMNGTYQFSYQGQTWYSGCSTDPHGDQPRDDFCAVIDSHAYLRAGIDPEGGDEYAAPSVVWGSSIENYGTYDDAIVSPAVEVTSGFLTLWIEVNSELPLKHNDLYADAVELIKVEN